MDDAADFLIDNPSPMKSPAHSRSLLQIAARGSAGFVVSILAFVMRLSVGFVVWASIGSLPLCAAQGFTAAGTVTMQGFLANGQPAGNPTTWEFRAFVDAHKWQIETKYGPGHIERFSCDGTNVYSYLTHPSTPDGGYLPGRVVPGTYPHGATIHPILPWLAFASKATLGDSRFVLPLPWRNSVADRAAFIARADIVYSPAYGQLPATISWSVDHAVTTNQQVTAAILDPISARIRGVTAEMLAQGWGQGELLGVFRVLSTRAVGQSIVPEVFELIEFHRRNGTNEQVTALRLSGKVSSLEAVAVETDPIPAISNRLSVVDYRFRNDHVSAAKYTITDGRWPAGDADAQRQVLASMTSSQKALVVNQRRFRILVLGAFLLIATAPALFIFRRSRTKYTTKHKTQLQTES